APRRGPGRRSVRSRRRLRREGGGRGAEREGLGAAVACAVLVEGGDRDAQAVGEGEAAAAEGRPGLEPRGGPLLVLHAGGLGGGPAGAREGLGREAEGPGGAGTLEARAGGADRDRGDLAGARGPGARPGEGVDPAARAAPLRSRPARGDGAGSR